MICSVTDNGYVQYPQDVRKFIPFAEKWNPRNRPHCLSSAQAYTLSANLIAVRVFLYKGNADFTEGEQVFFVDVEYKERGERGWSEWTSNQVSLPLKAEVWGGKVYMDRHPPLQEMRENVKDDINHLMTFFGATFA